METRSPKPEARNDAAEETVGELRAYGLRIVQHRHGYRFSLDTLILCAFAGVTQGEKVIDLGTGCGVIPLIMARSGEGTQIVGVEHQESLAELARRNVLLNDLDKRIAILHGDVTSLRGRFPASSFDLVVANPPYRRRGTGKVSPKAGRDLARHESTATLTDFLAAARHLVSLAGRICLIYHPSRLGELFAEAATMKLAPLRLRMVHGNSKAEARMFLVELVKGRKGDLVVMPPLFVYGEDGAYSGEMERIYGGDAVEGER